MRIFLLGVGVFVMVGSCATPTSRRPTISLPEIQDEVTFQARDQFREKMERHERIWQITDRLLYSNQSMCNSFKWQYGFSFLNPKVTREEHPLTNALMLDYLGLPKDEEYPVVTYINSGSAAEKSGLRRGDRIYKIGGKSALANRTEIRRFNHITGRMQKTSRLGWYNRLRYILKKMPENKQVTFQVKRRTQSDDEDTLITITMTKEPECQIQGLHVESSGVNAYTDGQYIAVTTGMLESTSEEELALVIAHELAHCFEGHISKKKSNAMWGAIGGALLDGLSTALGAPSYGRYERRAGQAGATAFSQSFELEADYVGLYIMARAGYYTGRAAGFWRKMGQRNPLDSNDITGTHPPTAERYILLEKTHAEIRQKITEGQPLEPNRLKNER